MKAGSATIYNNSLKLTNPPAFQMKASSDSHYRSIEAGKVRSLVPPLCWRNAGLYLTMIHIRKDHDHVGTQDYVAGKH